MKKLLSIILLSLAINFASAQEIGLKIGDIAPELAYNNPKGNQLKLSSLKGKLVLIDFWASWCGPCKTFGPTFEKVSESRDDIKFVKVNVDEANELASKYNVFSIPTLMIFNKGEVVAQQVGAASKDTYKNMIDRALGSL